MNALEAISPAISNPYGRYNTYSSPVDGTGQTTGQANPLDSMAQQLIMAGLVLSMLSDLLSARNAGGNPLSAGAQQPADPFQQFLSNLLNPMQQQQGAGGSMGQNSMALAVLTLLSQLFSPQNGADGSFSGGSQRQTDPFQDFLSNLLGALLPGGDGTGGSGSAGAGVYDNGGGGYSNGNGGYSNGNGYGNGNGNGYGNVGGGGYGNVGGGGNGYGYGYVSGGGVPGNWAPTPSTPNSALPPPTGVETVNEPIVIGAGQVFDGAGRLFQAGSQLGDGGQGEHQKPVFILEPGATLQNAQVKGADGVHMNGDATLKNVWWSDVGEDAATLKGPGNVTVDGGGAFNASDKVFQINAPGSITINNFYASDFDKLVRQNGGTDFPLTVKLSNIESKGHGEALVRTDSSNANILLSNVDSGGVKNDVLAPNGASVDGATNESYKPYTG